MADMLLVSVGAGLDCRERLASMALLYGLVTSTGGGEARCLCNISVEPIVHAVYSSAVSCSLPAGSTRLREREVVVDEVLGRGALVAL